MAAPMDQDNHQDQLGLYPEGDLMDQDQHSVGSGPAATDKVASVPISSLYTIKDGDLTLTFPSLEEMQRYLKDHPQSSKLETYGKSPKPFSGCDEHYSYEDFIDAYEGYVDITQPNRLVVLTLHSFEANPARKYMCMQLRQRAKTLQDVGYSEYKSLLKQFSYKPELTPTQQVAKLFNMKLHSNPIDKFYPDFSEQLMKCPEWVLDLPFLHIAAFYNAMPNAVQKLTVRDPAGNEWTTLAAYQSAWKEAITKLNLQSAATSFKRDKPTRADALKVKGGVK